MIRKSLTILLVVLLSFCSIFAQSTLNIEKSGGYARLSSMGNNPYVLDPFFMTLNPAWGAYYDNFIFGDLGSTQTNFGNDGAGQFIGANFRVMPNLTVGAILTRNDFNGRFSIGNIDPNGLVGSMNGIIGGGIIDMNNNFEIMASYKQGSHKFGFGFAMSGTSSEFNQADGNKSENSASQIGFNLGYLSNISRGLLVDVGFSIQLPSVSSTPTGGNESSASQTNIALVTRAFYNLSQKFKIVPAFTFVSSSGSADIANATGTTSSDLPSTSVIIFGAGIMYQSGNFLFAGGPSFLSFGSTQPSVDNFSPELTTTTSFFPAWNLGAEWEMLDWLYARFGYVSLTGSITTETAASATTVNERISTIYGPTGAFVGLGLKLGNLSIDGTVNSDVLRQGLNNLAGGGATFAYLSISIGFE